VLEQERRFHRIAAGEPGSPAPSPRAAPPAPRTAWEHGALGRAFLRSGDLPDASRELAAALELDPGGRWTNFYYGLCAYRTGHYEDAVTAFSVCIGTAPDSAGCFNNRALARAALHHDDEALHDFDRALQLDPGHADAALNRGMLHLRQGRLDRARADLALAAEHGVRGAAGLEPLRNSVERAVEGAALGRDAGPKAGD
jgi:eukaryotic-like serine/threonine-protein kinase